MPFKIISVGRRSLASTIKTMALVIKYILTFIPVSCIWHRPVARISHQGEPKNHKGEHIFKIQYWMYAATRSQTWNGGAQILNVRGGHHWSPAGDDLDLAASPLATPSAEITVSHSKYIQLKFQKSG